MKKRKLETRKQIFKKSPLLSHGFTHEEKKDIKRIDFKNSFIDSENVKILSLNLFNCGNLTQIDLSSNCIGVTGIAQLVSSILESRIPLQKLDISNNFIENYHSARLDELIELCPTLVDLNLSNTRPKNDGLKLFLTQLIYNRTLKQINLSRNTIGNGCKTILCELFEQNCTLRIVNLDHTKLHGIAISEIVHKIIQNPFLTCVSIFSLKIPSIRDILKDVFLKKTEEKKRVILTLCLIRDFCKDSCIHIDAFPTDMWNLLINFIL